jgi:Zn-dependent protease
MGGFRLFTLADVPVWVSPWYLLLLLYFTTGGRTDNPIVLGVCVTLSVLVHEFGHAIIAKRYKLQPEILLHGFGGLTSHRSAQTNGQEARIVAAGPFAGLLLAALSYAVLSLGPTVPALGAPALQSAAKYMFYINLVWSIFNLVPMWPMDGGQLFRLGMLKLFAPARAAKITHVTGIVLALLLGLIAYKLGYGLFMFFILALNAWQNVQALQASGAAPAVRRDNPHARELLMEAERAYERGDDDEAARLCQQIRAESAVPPQILARVWVILGVTATRKGEYEEALSYLKRAPDCAEVVEASAQCFYQLEMYEALDALTKTRAFGKLPNATREQIETALNEAVA